MRPIRRPFGLGLPLVLITRCFVDQVILKANSQRSTSNAESIQNISGKQEI